MAMIVRQMSSDKGSEETKHGGSHLLSVNGEVQDYIEAMKSLQFG